MLVRQSRTSGGLKEKMTPTGLELARQSSISDDSSDCAAPGAALGRNSDLIDAGLAEVVDAWPSLLAAVRADILATVRAASGAG